ncbi:DUF4263 domain-containing protein [Candidatus Shapirobacteria bacterium]|nr:DUF4263 domain-containing protein [Candidatus Shapirobacteria bacterium]
MTHNNHWKLVEPAEEEIAANSRTDVLYMNEFSSGKGKYFNFYVTDSEEFQISQQIKLKITIGYIEERKNIERVVIEKFRLSKDGWKKTEEKIILSNFTFEKVMSFILFLKELDLTGITERRIRLFDNSFITLDEDTKKKIVTLLSTEEGEKLLEELVKNGMITSVDIVNIGYRKTQLDIFYKLLNEPGFIKKYQEQEKLRDQREEISWQHFFKKNPWIFGYGLDYRFLGILQKEAYVSNTNIAGEDGEIGDYLLGCNKFTVLVELKKPTSRIFGTDKNRSGSWCLSEDLVHAVSQILEQKASWQIKAETNASKNFNDKGRPIKQQTIDPKTILVYGNSNQFSGENEEQRTKARTYELFQRDSRNLDIFTFDELYERASHIVEDAKNGRI